MQAGKDGSRRSPGVDLILVAGTFVVTIAVLAPHAAAISNIDNNFSIRPTRFCGGKKVDIRADVVFDWQYEPNPYYSNYRMAVRWHHFYRPGTYSDDTEGERWYYKANDDWLDLGYDPPTYRWDSGTFLVIPTQYRHTYASATARYARDGGRSGRLRNKLHQYGSYSSKGQIVHVYSEHC